MSANWSVDELTDGARTVLDDNWLGTSTKPSGHLYPHQWSWDSAFIAIGNARSGHVDRSVTELRSLFGAQWSTGMVPHMVFDQSVTGYFPSAELWGTRPISAMPDGVLTSGMCQPPVHALAVRDVAHSFDHVARRAFLAEMFDPLVAWHDYLHRTRTVGSPLIELWHPWEAGMDNSPVWDAALLRLDPDPADIPHYRRVDTDHADAAERPTTDHYDRYIYLLEQLRRVEYQPTDAAELPYRVCDVLFNALTAHADAELARIADELDASSASNLRDRSASLASAIDTEMWSDELGLYVDVDRTTRGQIDLPIAGGLVPLLLADTLGHRRELVATLRDTFAVSPDPSDGLVIPTVPSIHPAFEPDRYWRGPAWINIMWLLIRGLRDGGEVDLADQLREGALGLVGSGGCAEYFNPITGEPRGATEFSWTAALVLDLLAE